MSLTSSVFIDLANAMKYGGRVLYNIVVTELPFKTVFRDVTSFYRVPRFSFTELSVSVTVTHWAISWHLQIFNTRGLCRLLRHRLPTSSQQFINQAREVRSIRDWSVVFRCSPAHPLPTHCNLCTKCSSYKPEGIYQCSTFNFIFIDN